MGTGDAESQPVLDQQPVLVAEPIHTTRIRLKASSSAADGEPSAEAAGEPGSEAETQPDKEIPLSSLPDLTQGIPSTLDYETAGSTNKAALAPFTEEGTASAGGRGKGELPASAYISSSERRRQKLANYLFFGAVGLGVAGTVYAGRDWDEEDAKRHPQVPNGWGLGLWWDRVSTRTKELLTYYHEPAFEKLLPDPDPVYGRPYTLCISLEDMLIHSEWTREHGWRIAKRPGVDYFLHYLSQYYELVLFTTVPFAMGEPMVRKLDPYRFIVYPLFREATKYQDGEIIKDLSYLNRDLSKVIIIDTNASHVRAQPENAIVLPKWTGDVKDTNLVALIPFLEYIYTMQYGDVRKVLKSFEGKDIPQEFARREAIARAEFQKQLEGQRKKHPHSGESGIGRLGSMLGLKSSNMSVMVPVDGEPNVAEQFAQGKMLQDIARERGQKTYEMMEKEIRENGEKWLKEEAAMQEKLQQEAMQSMKQSFAGWFVNPPKTAEQPNAAPGSQNKQ
ncbi:mitochondrial translocase complex component [Niveomyces insectorum RCEF 264]|uniref:Mitochondrial import inner membrane translocase subunit TIM50 n=1 Tax=Niveomyces insectorum RCEF 264 TaxID=1081102 RepID=A0A167N914_9HYPO|nr:mitochondrial translocase complex component [Niveomyces insectorum RCEF 264]